MFSLTFIHVAEQQDLEISEHQLLKTRERNTLLCWSYAGLGAESGGRVKTEVCGEKTKKKKTEAQVRTSKAAEL